MSDKKQLPDKCAVTRDLMPLCIDGTASEASQRRVKKHVVDCPPCATVYQEMQTQIDLDTPDQQEAAQFDTAVKKVKHKHAWRKLRNVLLGVLLALVVCAGAGVTAYELALWGTGLFLGLTRFERLGRFFLTGVYSTVAMVPLYWILNKIGTMGGRQWKE